MGELLVLIDSSKSERLLGFRRATGGDLERYGTVVQRHFVGNA